MSREYDPDAIRDVGKWVIPSLATTYERFESLVVQAGAGLDAGGVSKTMSGTFVDYHLLLRNAIAETSENYRGLGPTLVAIAEDDEVTEAEIKQELEDLGEGVADTWSDKGYGPMGTGEQTDAMEPAPSPYDSDL